MTFKCCNCTYCYKMIEVKIFEMNDLLLEKRFNRVSKEMLISSCGLLNDCLKALVKIIKSTNYTRVKSISSRSPLFRPRIREKNCVVSGCDNLI